jgi:hypothetical protein
MSSYGFFGFKAIGESSSPREVICRSCGTTWVRASIKELRREAERRIDERYQIVEAENERLRAELAGLTKPAPTEPAPPPVRDDALRPGDGQTAN